MMKKLMLSKPLLIILVSSLIILSFILHGCKKDEVSGPYDPYYQPTFTSNYSSVHQGGDELIEISVICTSDDWQMVKMDVIYPNDEGNELFTMDTTVQLRGEPFSPPNSFTKIVGIWTISIHLNIKSGPYIGNSHFVSIILNVNDE